MDDGVEEACQILREEGNGGGKVNHMRDVKRKKKNARGILKRHHQKKRKEKTIRTSKNECINKIIEKDYIMMDCSFASLVLSLSVSFQVNLTVNDEIRCGGKEEKER